MSDEIYTTPDNTHRQVSAPDLPYQPPRPKAYNPAIGFIACGGITHNHLTAYKNAGFRVVALCDINRQATEARISKTARKNGGGGKGSTRKGYGMDEHKFDTFEPALDRQSQLSVWHLFIRDMRRHIHIIPRAMLAAVMTIIK